MRGRMVLTAVLSATALLGMAAGIGGGQAAAAEIVGFRTPSGNVHCQYVADTTRTGSTTRDLRCDILQSAAPPVRRPASCDLDYGDSLGIRPTGAAYRICHGDTVADPANPVLIYGATWRKGGFSCTSATSGLTCRNAGGHGFTMARTAQTLF